MVKRYNIHYYWKYDVDLQLMSLLSLLHKKIYTMEISGDLRNNSCIISSSGGDRLFRVNADRMVHFLRMSARHGSAQANTETRGPIPPICQAKVTGHISAHLLVNISRNSNINVPAARNATETCYKLIFFCKIIKFCK